jgi:radical SAM-linked protein
LDNIILVLVQFRIRGVLRFVSHAEMLKVFQRAFARAGVKVRHSQGFNPHPKVSLPLPRPVGVESDDELLCVQVSGDPDESQIKERLSEQLPEGCELLSVSFMETADSIQPSSATYVVPLKTECINDKLRTRIDRLLASDSLVIERKINSKEKKIKTLDVRPFVKSIELENENITVECKVTPDGSIRVDEILRLLEIETQVLAAPVRRTKVQWQKNRRQNSEDGIILTPDTYEM